MFCYSDDKKPNYLFLPICYLLLLINNFLFNFLKYTKFTLIFLCRDFWKFGFFDNFSVTRRQVYDCVNLHWRTKISLNLTELCRLHWIDLLVWCWLNFEWNKKLKRTKDSFKLFTICTKMLRNICLARLKISLWTVYVSS